MAVMIHRALLATEKIQENKSYSALEKYQDDSHIADYAKESVSVLTGEGMIQGDQNHSLSFFSSYKICKTSRSC